MSWFNLTQKWLESSTSPQLSAVSTLFSSSCWPLISNDSCQRCVRQFAASRFKKKKDESPDRGRKRSQDYGGAVNCCQIEPIWSSPGKGKDDGGESGDRWGCCQLDAEVHWHRLHQGWRQWSIHDCRTKWWPDLQCLSGTILNNFGSLSSGQISKWHRLLTDKSRVGTKIFRERIVLNLSYRTICPLNLNSNYSL